MGFCLVETGWDLGKGVEMADEVKFLKKENERLKRENTDLMEENQQLRGGGKNNSAEVAKLEAEVARLTRVNDVNDRAREEEVNSLRATVAEKVAKVKELESAAKAAPKTTKPAVSTVAKDKEIKKLKQELKDVTSERDISVKQRGKDADALNQRISVLEQDLIETREKLKAAESKPAADPVIANPTEAYSNLETRFKKLAAISSEASGLLTQKGAEIKALREEFGTLAVHCHHISQGKYNLKEKQEDNPAAAPPNSGTQTQQSAP